jgi:hypothetical protein
MANRTDRYLKLRLALRKFRDAREEAKRIAEGVSKQQPEVIALMQSLDPENVGIVIDENDKSKGTAYVQQNEGSLVWDEEAIIDWLSTPSRRLLKKKAESRVFDINKWEALVASKEVPAKIAKKFQSTTEPPKPFIRFGKKGDESL